MSNDAEKQKVSLTTFVLVIVAIGSFCFAVGVYKNSNDKAREDDAKHWEIQTKLNEQYGDRITVVETKVNEQETIKASVRDLKDWLIAYVNAKTGSRTDTGLLNHDTRQPN